MHRLLKSPQAQIRKIFIIFFDSYPAILTCLCAQNNHLSNTVRLSIQKYVRILRNKKIEYINQLHVHALILRLVSWNFTINEHVWPTIVNGK